MAIGFGFISSPVIYDAYPIYPFYPATTYVVTQPPYQQNVYVDSGGDYFENAYRHEVPAAPSVTTGQELYDTGISGVGSLPNKGKQETASMPADEMHRLMLEGTQLFTQGEYERAAQMFLQVAMADGQNVDAVLAFAVARFATGDYATSAVAARRGVRIFPEVVNSTFDIRDRYGQMPDFDRHLEALEDFVREHPDNVDGWVVLGFVRHFTGQREPAARTFEVLKRRSPSDADLADVFLKAKPLEELLPPEEDTPTTGSGDNEDEQHIQETRPSISLEPAYEIPSP